MIPFGVLSLILAVALAWVGGPFGWFFAAVYGWVGVDLLWFQVRLTWLRRQADRQRGPR